MSSVKQNSSFRESLLKEYCNEPRLSDADIIELFDSEGIEMTKGEIQKMRDSQTWLLKGNQANE